MTESTLPVKTFGRYPSIVDLPDLVEIQTKAYEAFLAPGIASGARDAMGLENHDLFEMIPSHGGGRWHNGSESVHQARGCDAEARGT